MNVTLEQQILTALKSLWAMFPEASMVSVDLECDSRDRASGGHDTQLAWSIYVAREEGNISISKPVLADAVAAAMLKGASSGKLQQVAQVVQLAALAPRPHLNRVSLN
jgi:hypothetical protein